MSQTRSNTYCVKATFRGDDIFRMTYEQKHLRIRTWYDENFTWKNLILVLWHFNLGNQTFQAYVEQ